MSAVPLIPRRKATPEQAEADLARRLLSDIWTCSVGGMEIKMDARDYNSNMMRLAPGRALLIRIAGADWEAETTPDTIAANLPPDLPFATIFEVWLGKALGPATLSTSGAFFLPHPDMAQIATLLKQAGYLAAQDAKVKWTDKAAPILIAAGKWNADGTSNEDLQTARAKASSDFRKRQTRDKAQGLLDSMPPHIRAEFDAVADTHNVLQAYDVLDAHYERVSSEEGRWRDTPRPIETPSKAGCLNRPDMGTNIAVEMFDIASGGFMTFMRAPPVAELNRRAKELTKQGMS